MHSELLPAVLKFNNVAANSHIGFTLTTAGVSWSLGALSGDSFDSCIQKIELNEQTLSITTANDNSGSLSSFSLTLSVKVASGVDYLQGDCTLNNEANVMAYFGSQRANEWRNGRISATLRNMKSQYRQIRIAVRDALPDNRISLEIGNGDVYWCLGLPFLYATPLRGPEPLNYKTYGNSRVMFETAQMQDSGSEAMDFQLSVYVGWQDENLRHFYLKGDCDYRTSLYAQVGNRQPQMLGPTYTRFTL
jgi:hypothetical protein